MTSINKALGIKESIQLNVAMRQMHVTGLRHYQEMVVNTENAIAQYDAELDRLGKQLQELADDDLNEFEKTLLNVRPKTGRDRVRKLHNNE